MMAKAGESDDDGVDVHNGNVRKDVSGKRFQSQHDVSTDLFYCSAAVHFVNRVVKIRTVAGKMESLDNRFLSKLKGFAHVFGGTTCYSCFCSTSSCGSSVSESGSWDFKLMLPAGLWRYVFFRIGY